MQLHEQIKTAAESIASHLAGDARFNQSLAANPELGAFKTAGWVEGFLEEATTRTGSLKLAVDILDAALLEKAAVGYPTGFRGLQPQAPATPDITSASMLSSGPDNSLVGKANQLANRFFNYVGGSVKPPESEPGMPVLSPSASAPQAQRGTETAISALTRDPAYVASKARAARALAAANEPTEAVYGTSTGGEQGPTQGGLALEDTGEEPMAVSDPGSTTSGGGTPDWLDTLKRQASSAFDGVKSQASQFLDQHPDLQSALPYLAGAGALGGAYGLYRHFTHDSKQPKTAESNMTKQDLMVAGFVKAAADVGLNDAQILDLTKRAFNMEQLQSALQSGGQQLGGMLQSGAQHAKSLAGQGVQGIKDLAGQGAQHASDAARSLMLHLQDSGPEHAATDPNILEQLQALVQNPDMQHAALGAAGAGALGLGAHQLFKHLGGGQPQQQEEEEQQPKYASAEDSITAVYFEGVMKCAADYGFTEEEALALINLNK